MICSFSSPSCNALIFVQRMKRLLASIEEERKVLEKQAFSQTPVQGNGSVVVVMQFF